MTWRVIATTDAATRVRPWLPVEVHGTQFVLASSDGAWYAVEDRCSHAGCPLSSEAALDGSTIICNCHGSEFDLPTGEVRRGPAEDPLRTIPVRVRDGRLEIDV